jgi:hypothetical protein
MPVIPALRRQGQQNHEFKTSLNYIVNSTSAWTGLKKQNKTKRKKRNLF